MAAPSGKRKSKSFPNNPTNDAISPPSSRQQTISQLFTASQHKQSTQSSANLALSPQSKRRKLSPPATPDSASALPFIKTASDMYNFPSKQNGGAVIDLTTSPGPSPGNRTRKLSVSARVENAPSSTGPRRLSIKNQKTSKSDPTEFCQRTFSQLDAAVTAIFHNQRPALSYEELYRGAENLCKLGKADELTKFLMTRCRDHVENDLKEPLFDIKNASSGKPVDVLRAFLSAWSTWMKQMSTLRSVFYYLDRSFLLQTQTLSIHDKAVSLFRSYVFFDCGLHDHVINGACQLLLNDRMGKQTERALFSDTVKMLHELQIYTSDFEPKMLALSQDWIREWAERECSQKDMINYVKAAEALMQAELERCDTFGLDPSTKGALLNLLESHLIEHRQAELTDLDAIADLLDMDEKDAVANLAALYSLLQRRHLGMKLQAGFSKWIDDTGTSVVFDEKEQEKMVERLLELKQKLDNIWYLSFKKDSELGHTLRNTFETFMNKTKKSATWSTDNSRTGEMIAKYVDLLLKAGAKAIPSNLRTSVSKPAKLMQVNVEQDENEDVDEDTEVDNQLDQVLDLFRFVHGKAVFEAFYKKDLARRLLMGRSASHDAEKNMLARLKTECGAGFTHNLEVMFKDIELAEEEARAYKGRLENNSTSSIDLNVNILSSAAWPTYPDIPVAMPASIMKAISDFEAFYHLKHSGRKLSWKHSLAHCQMRADFPKGKKDLIVSSFQAIVLLLFNDVKPEEHLSYEHIKATTLLPEAEVKRTLQSLACAKLRPLTKHPRGREINDTDTFTVNTAFSHDKFRVKINAIQLKETKEENRETHVRVAADRQFETQAAIVRILKSKKSIAHAVLISDVISATRTRGVLQPNDIKKEIDKLIEKEYMERAENNTYNYLA